jgi:ligand-binding sensor domain-containing protein
MKIEAENYEVVFGSNQVLKCGKVIELTGKGINKQIIRFREGEDGKIVFNCTIADQDGQTVAKIANCLVQHIKPGYRVDTSDKGIKVLNESTGEVWLEFVHIGSRKFKLNGIFFLPGFKIVATDNYLEINKINTIRMSNNTFESCSVAIGLGQ